MTTKEALEQVGGSESRTIILAAGLIADAIIMLAKAQEHSSQIQEKQWALALGMMDKISPMIDKSVDMLNEETEGEQWKRGLPDNED